MPRSQQNDSTNAAATSSGSAGIAAGGASATAASSSSANAPISPVSSGNYLLFIWYISHQCSACHRT